MTVRADLPIRRRISDGSMREDKIRCYAETQEAAMNCLRRSVATANKGKDPRFPSVEIAGRPVFSAIEMPLADAIINDERAV